MASVARRALSKVNLTFAAAAGVLIVVVGLLGCYEAVARYFFNQPTTWATDLAGFLLVYIAFLGLPLTLEDGQHVSVELFVDWVRGPVRAGAIALGWVLTVVYVAVFGWFVTRHTAAAFTQDWLSTSMMAVPLKYVFVVGPICAALFLITAIVMAIEAWIHPEHAPAGPSQPVDAASGGADR